ncbi:MAG: choice-of-anchor D domain-containing protein, partial [Candidatus Cloacimonetes bacterium]|nr:choice-of-anchor D domain-containing protein [Candidatus Cloacimonadota bacterium]
YTLKNGATEVFNGFIDFNHSGWLILDIDDFAYNNNNLLVMCETLYGYAITTSYNTFGFSHTTSIYPTNMQHQVFLAGSLWDIGPAYSLGTYNDQLPAIIFGGIVENPDNLTATDTEYNSISLGWELNRNENSVVIAVSTSDFPDNPIDGITYNIGDSIGENATIIYEGNDLSFHHTNLMGETTYYYKIWSLDLNIYSYGYEYSNTTLPAPVSDFPLIETFESTQFPPNNWSYEGTSGILMRSDHAEAYQNAGTCVVANTIYGESASLISPAFDLSSLSNPLLKFDYAHGVHRYEENSLEIYYSIDDGESYTLLQAVNGGLHGILNNVGIVNAGFIPRADEWSTHILPLPQNANRVKLTINPEGGAELYLDNITFDEGNASTNLHISPTDKLFGQIQKGNTSTYQTFEIRNTGLESLQVTGISITDDPGCQFEVIGLGSYPVTLNAGQSETIYVAYKPTVTGDKACRLVVSYHTTEASTFEVNIRGTGIDETILEIPYLQNWGTYNPEEGNSWDAFNLESGSSLWYLSYDEGTQNLEEVIRNNTSSDLNSWLMSPPLQLFAGTPYTISYDTKSTSNLIQHLEVALTPISSYPIMDETLRARADITSTIYQTDSVDFSVTETDIYYLGFHACTPSASVVWGSLYLDNILLSIPNSQISQYVIDEATEIISFDPISIQGQIVSPTMSLSGLSIGQYLSVSISDNPSWGLSGAGMVIFINSTSLSGISVTLNHYLNFVPDQIAYRIGNDSIQLIDNPGTWTTETISFNPDAGRSGEKLVVYLPKNEEAILPVTLSDFTAMWISENDIKLQWVMETAINLSGFNVYRAEMEDFESSTKVNGALITEYININTQKHYLYHDLETESGTNYNYWLESVELDGTVNRFGPVQAIVSGDPDQPDNPEITYRTVLGNAYPNPFNPTTTISYSVAESGLVRIDIFNVKGQLVKSFRENHSVPGNYNIVWDGRNIRGEVVNSGILFYRMTSGSYSSTHKMLMLK